MFVCLQTTANHIEVVASMSAESFLMAFARFSARRCTPKVVKSDNGTNFIKASKLLETSINTNDLSKAAPEVKWDFNTPLTPHQGGIWERAIGVLKRSLKTIVPKIRSDDLRPHLTEEELNTVMTVAEGLMNSRPLCVVSTDAEDVSPITPGHFLGSVEFVTPLVTNRGGKEVTLGAKYQRLEQILQNLWTELRKALLPKLNQLNKRWLGNRANLRVGDAVVVFDDSTPRYPIGRVIKTLPNSQDGICRSADVVVNGRVYRRSLTKLSKLLGHDEALPEGGLSESIPEIPAMPKTEPLNSPNLQPLPKTSLKREQLQTLHYSNCRS